jgi:hypothetical protein
MTNFFVDWVTGAADHEHYNAGGGGMPFVQVPWEAVAADLPKQRPHIEFYLQE